MYWENTECNKGVEKNSEYKFGQTGRGKTTRRENRECGISYRSESALLTYSPPMIK